MHITKKMWLFGAVAILLILYYFSTYFILSYIDGEKRIAEIKARESFFLRDFPMTLIPYAVHVSEEDKGDCRLLFQQHRVYFTSGYVDGMSPASEVAIVAVSNDGKAFFLPDEFNQAIKNENFSVNSREKALEVAAAYLSCSAPYGDIMIVQNFTDIFFKGRGKDPAQIADKISPVRISQTNGDYRIDLFTWKSIGGAVYKWSLIVDEKGEVNLLEKIEIERNIGSVIGLG